MDWTIDKENYCIAGIYDDFKGITYFPVVENGVLEDSSFSDKIIGVATQEMQKLNPNMRVTESWSYLMFLLKTSICYVEYLGFNGQLRKMLLCANLNLIRECHDISLNGVTHHLTDATNINKFNSTHVLPTTCNEIKGIKINKKLLTEVRQPMLLRNSIIRVAPICLMLQNANIILNTGGISKYEYYKDNGTIRDIVTTKDRGTLTKHYTSEKVDEMIADSVLSIDTILNRGYMRVIELGASKYDSGVRAINVAKIKSERQIDESEVDYRFVDVDLSTVVDTFKYHMERIDDLHILNTVLHDLTDINSVADSKPYILGELFGVVDSNVTYGSTQYLRALYLYMVDRPQIFSTVVKGGFSIDMGVTSDKGYVTGIPDTELANTELVDMGLADTEIAELTDSVSEDIDIDTLIADFGVADIEDIDIGSTGVDSTEMCNTAERLDDKEIDRLLTALRDSIDNEIGSTGVDTAERLDDREIDELLTALGDSIDTEIKDMGVSPNTDSPTNIGVMTSDSKSSQISKYFSKYF